MKHRKSYTFRKKLVLFISGLSIASIATVVLATNIIFTKHVIDSDFDGVTSVYAVDMDKDGDMDILGAANSASDIAWWENDGNEAFTKRFIDSNFEGAFSVYAIDLDDDGDIDVLGAGIFADDITWWENDGSQSFTKHAIDADFNGARSVYAADMDNDGDIDVLGTAVIVDDVTWWENDGNENFTSHTIDGDFDGANSVYAIDIDQDGDMDVLASATEGDEISWWQNNGSQVFTKNVVKSDFNGASSVYATDMDDDGDIDILGSASTDGDVVWWENNGSQVFTEHTIDGDFDGAYDVYALDMDNDGDIDILGASPTLSNIAWWENNGSEVFSRKVVDSNFLGAYSVYSADVDGDGDVDILGSANIADDIAWWENNLDISRPTVTFNPLFGTGNVASDSNVTITFSEAIRNIDDSEITDLNVDSLVMLRNSDVTGDNIAFDATISADKTVITINPTSDFLSEQFVFVGIEAIVEDASNNVIFASTATFIIEDCADPIVSVLSPLDNATDIALDSNLVITFNEEVDVKTGDIVIRKTSDDSVVETFNVATDLAGSGTTQITINPTSDLDYETEYYVLINATAFDDLAGNSYAGISDSTAWTFTTVDAPICPAIANAATYNAYPTCGVATCNSGYTVSDGACVQVSQGNSYSPPASIGGGLVDSTIGIGKTRLGFIINEEQGNNFLVYINSTVGLSCDCKDYIVKVVDLNMITKKVTISVNGKLLSLFPAESRNISGIKIAYNKLFINRIDLTIEKAELAQASVYNKEKDAPEDLTTPITEPLTNEQKEIVQAVKETVENAKEVFTVYEFKQDLELGMENSEVKELQKYLNKLNYIPSGPGSLGQETNYFGSITQNALIKFQKDNNIYPSHGYFGPITRRFISAK